MDLKTIAQFYNNHLVPKDAKLIRSLYRASAETSKQANLIQSVALPRLLLAPASVIVAPISALGYAARGILQGSVEIIDGNFIGAKNSFLKDALSTVQCIALIVGNIAYAILALFIGASVFQAFDLEQATPSGNTAILKQEIEKQKAELTETLQEKALARQQKNQAVEQNEVQITSLNTKIRELIAELGRCQSMEQNKDAEIKKLKSEIKDLISELGRWAEKNDQQELLHEANHQLLIAQNQELQSQLEATRVSLPTGEAALNPHPETNIDLMESTDLSTSAVAAGPAPSVVTNVWNFFVDGQDPWKEHRYQLAFSQLFKVVSPEKINRWFGQFNHLQDPASQSFCGALKTLLGTKKYDFQRERYHEFRRLISDTLEHLAKTPNPELSKAINELSALRFTKTSFLAFYKELILYIATNHINEEGKRELQTLSLHRRTRRLLRRIKEAPSEMKIPRANVEAAKLQTVTPWYEPLVNNIPNPFAISKYRNGAENLLTTIHTRTGVPIGPGYGTDSDPWTLEGVSILREYISYLDHLKSNNQKILIVLHLDPNRVEADPSVTDLVNLKSKEALWIRLLLKLSKSDRYKSFVSVATLPLDGPFMEREESLDSDEFKNKLKTSILEDPTLFNLPIENKENVIDSLIKQVYSNYFAQVLKNGMLTPDDQLAFIPIFYCLLSEYMQLTIEADIVQHNCKDGIDRTGAVIGTKLALEALHQGLLRDAATIANITGSTLGPALANAKRELHNSRQKILLLALEHIEKLNQLNINTPTPLKRKSAIEGYELLSLTMEEDPTQTVNLPFPT